MIFIIPNLLYIYIYIYKHRKNGVLFIYLLWENVYGSCILEIERHDMFMYICKCWDQKPSVWRFTIIISGQSWYNRDFWGCPGGVLCWCRTWNYSDYLWNCTIWFEDSNRNTEPSIFCRCPSSRSFRLLCLKYNANYFIRCNFSCGACYLLNGLIYI